MSALSYPEGYSPRREPHCGVLSVAIAAGVSFEQVWDIMAKRRQRPGAWKGRTCLQDRTLALKALGVEFSELVPVRPMQLATWVRTFARPGVTYSVTVTGHVLTVRDGLVIDQRYCGPVSGCRSARRIVKHIITIQGRSN